MLHLLVVGGRHDLAGARQLGELFGRDVLDVASSLVERRDDLGLDVDEQHSPTRARERRGQRDADVPGADDRDVVVGALCLRHGGQAYRAAATRSAA